MNYKLLGTIILSLCVASPTFASYTPTNICYAIDEGGTNGDYTGLYVQVDDYYDTYINQNAVPVYQNTENSKIIEYTPAVGSGYWFFEPLASSHAEYYIADTADPTTGTIVNNDEPHDVQTFTIVEATCPGSESTSTATTTEINATSTLMALTSINFGLAIIITILMIFAILLIYNHMFEKKHK